MSTPYCPSACVKVQGYPTSIISVNICSEDDLDLEFS